MEKLRVVMKHCYGIPKLEKEFDFKNSNPSKPMDKAYAIYAPNGVMKTSFAKTFDALSKGDEPKEERYGRKPSWVVQADGQDLPKEAMYVLKAEVEFRNESPAATNILVKPEQKKRYDALIVDIEKKKSLLINKLAKMSKEKKNDVEQTVIEDCSMKTLPECIMDLLDRPVDEKIEKFQYKTIFEPKAFELLKSEDFISKSKEFTERYQELFEMEGTIYRKGVFNPAKADTTFDSLKKHGFFDVGHRVHLCGEDSSIDHEELMKKREAIDSRIDADEKLKNIRLSLAKNAQTQALTNLIEKLSSSDVSYLLERVKPDNQKDFRIEIWAYYIQNSTEAKSYLESYLHNKEELSDIEEDATRIAEKWLDIVSLFNNRFIDMPFTLSVANQVNAALGKEEALLKFTFKDGDDRLECDNPEDKSLCQGELRALNLLYFIFEVEDRKLNNQETLFIIDDVADSFDYKNKHAILQYLSDLCKVDFFHQIILTHNFDFFRSLSQNLVHRDRCLMSIKGNGVIILKEAHGINNIFVKAWRDRVNNNNTILYSTVPFTRNLIEYTKGCQHDDYLTLTKLLHWKEDTASITVGKYLSIYNKLFSKNCPEDDETPMLNVLFTEAEKICSDSTHEGLNLENKVLLSIAIRMKAEQFITQRLRNLKNDSTYWCQTTSQFGNLLKELKELDQNASGIDTIEKVSVTVSSNIHLNSFMYEPILDLSIEHLISLYKEVCGLNDLHL